MSQSKKTAYLISCSDHYKHRLFAVDAYLRGRGYETTYLTSDFDHTTKKVFRCEVNGCIQLPSRPYRKNLSAARILSHRAFARDAFQYLEKLPRQPDAVVALLPPNFLAHYAKKYKKRHPQVKLVFDIFDMWPETFPSGNMKKLLRPAFAVWAWVRDHSLDAADFITTECELFRRLLKLDPGKSATVYLCADPLNIPKAPVRLREDRIEFCYLGSINNVVSIPDICAFIAKLTAEKPVVLHIVGIGERQQEFIDSAKAAGAEVVFYGAVFDDAKKQEIISRCHFGLNIMKSSVCVGLTMKSVEYFRHGLPIINNIPADTAELVAQKGVGLQLGEDCVQRLLKISNHDCLKMRENVNAAFKSFFETSVTARQYDALLTPLLE
ncbi:MAG: glycosyltransferase [Oscillospiraceae bacterium]|nr:glycosyltransferase [Oscillospiraceae bacterium]